MELCYFRKFKLDNNNKIGHFGGSVLRNPTKYRKTWSPPPRGWIKLNFDGHSYRSSGYGGFLCNDKGETLLSYAGPIRNANIHLGEYENTIAAQVEGLKQGVRCFKKLTPHSCDDSYLIIEGSALSVIRWANNLSPPPHKFFDVFDEMPEILKETKVEILYIFQEANIKANQLAKLGTSISEFSSWK